MQLVLGKFTWWIPRTLWFDSEIESERSLAEMIAEVMSTYGGAIHLFMYTLTLPRFVNALTILSLSLTCRSFCS